MRGGNKHGFGGGLLRYLPFILFFVFLILASFVVYPSGLNNMLAGNVLFSNQQVISESFLNTLLSIIFGLIAITGLIIFFTLKLRKINSELQKRNKEVLDINKTLYETNKELDRQKEKMAREHYESDRFYEMMVQSASDGIAFYDSNSNLKFANLAFYTIIGLTRNSYLTLDLQSLIHPDDRDYVQNRKQALKDEGFYETELRLMHADGNYLTLSTRSVVVKRDDGEIIGSLTISRDITRMRLIHEELIKANIEAETSNRLKTSFLANISHEIRTPLNSVVGFSNLLLSDNLTNEMKEEYIEHINHNSEKLLQIIGDIIDLSRLESAQIEISYEETSLISIVNEIVEDARKEIRRNEKPIILTVKNQFENNSDLIFTDKIWLKRVLGHLMDNAVKFTLDGSIEFSYMRENEDVLFKVKDTGIGINKENLGRIFEEFRQEIDGHHRPFEGLGIGLTLAKEVVERMGGKISVQSEKGFGSEFTFSIPFRPAGRIKMKPNQQGSEVLLGMINWSSKKCLLVDDNKDVLLYLKRILVDTGINSISARSGYEAIEIVRNTPDLDLVLLDMQMPEMNGIEATREIRKIRKNLPIIAQTAFIFEDEKDIILEAGCDACLIKPIRKDHLITVISSFIKSK